MNAANPATSTKVLEPIGPGRFVLVVGPSGGGKDTLIAGTKVLCSGDPTVVFPRRVVTRPATKAEDHDSLDDTAFDHAVDAGAFAFWWQAHGLKYGIPRSADSDIRDGRIVVCNVSRGTVDAARARYVRVDTVLITAPANVLATRLSGRLRDSDGSLADRLKRSETFTAFRADIVIDNTGAPAAAIEQLFNVIKAGTAPHDL